MIPEIKPISNCFPDDVKIYAEQFSASCGTSSDYFYAGVLAASSALCAGSKLQIKVGYKECPSLFMVAVGEPSLAKSPPLKEAMRFLKKMQNEEFKQYDRDMAEFNKLSKGEKEKSPEPPEPCFYITGSGTVEGICKGFKNADNIGRPCHTIYHKDELNAFFGEMNQYRSNGKGGDEEFYLEMFNGGSPSTARATKMVNVNSFASVTIVGTIQPTVMRKAMKSKGNGMLERFIFFAPSVKLGASQIFIEPTKEARGDYKDFFDHLSASKRDNVYDLSHECKEEFQRIYDWFFALGGSHETGIFKKWEQQFHKILLNLAFLWEVEEITPELIHKAEILIRYFAEHWLRGYEITDLNEHETMKIEIKEMIEKKGKIFDREIKRKSRFQGMAKEVDLILQELVSECFIECKNSGDEKKVGRKAKFYRYLNL